MSEQLIYLALALILGYGSAWLLGKLHLPAVTGYLVAGLVLSLFKVIPMTSLHGFSIISDIALGFIAFAIGSEFKLDFLRQLGKAPIIIAILESAGAVLVIFAALLLFRVPLPEALLLGAIGAATAPAATLMVVRQYQAKGPVTRMLLPVVAMDDASALMLFSIAAAIAQVLVKHQQLSIVSMILLPLLEIVGSLLIGTLLGFLLALFLRRIDRDNDRLIFTVALIFAGIGLSAWLGLSALLTCMALGAVFVNLSRQAVHTFKIADTVTPPLFLLFFVLSGAELDVTVLRSIGLIGLIYIVGRVIGKFGGAWLGAWLVKAEPNVQRYLGWTLIPQAGVAIGLSTLALRIAPDYGAHIRAIILCATLVYELSGPVVTKIALRRAGEIEAHAEQKT